MMLIIYSLIAGVETQKPNAVKGVIDLRKTDFAKEKIINLDGEWEFYWNQLLMPEDFTKNQKIDHKKSYISIPGNWKKDIYDNKFSGKGFGTFRLLITNIPNKNLFGIKKQNIRNASKIYINGKLVLADGNPAKTREENLYSNIPQKAFFEIDDSELEIVIQVSNYEIINGGIATSLYFGEHQQLISYSSKNTMFEAGIITMLITIGLYYIFYYFVIKAYGRKEPTIIIFSMCCILFAIMNMTISERIILVFFPKLSYEFIYKFKDIATLTALILITIFLDKIVKDLMNRIRNIVIGFYVMFLLLIIILPVEDYLRYIGILMIINIAFFVSVFVRSIYLFLNKKSDRLDFKSYTALIFLLYSVNLYNIYLILFSIGAEKDYFKGFICILVISILALLLLSFRLSDEYKKNKEISHRLTKTFLNLEKTLQESERNEIAFLQAQIKPHFLFNTMSSIISLCYTDGKRAGELLTNLANYLKKSFSINNNDKFVTIEREIELIQQYIDIQKTRFENRLKVEYDIDEAIYNFKITPLIIQPLVENAIKHGILKKEEGGKIQIIIQKREDEIYICVEDDGVGMRDEEVRNIYKVLMNNSHDNNGIGLANINKRLEKYYQEKIYLNTKKGEGTKIYFKIPIAKMNHEIDKSLSVTE